MAKESTYGNKATLVDADRFRLVNSVGPATANVLWSLIKSTLGFTAASAAGATSLKFYEDTDNGVNYSALTGPALLGANQSVVMPSASGTLALTADVDAAVVGLLDFKGAQDCSANPNYPSALKGDAYLVSVAGKIGGGSGTTVAVGDMFVCTADNAGGSQAGVGTSWSVLEKNLVDPYIAGGTDVAIADGGTGSSTAAGARTNLGVGTGDSPTFAGTLLTPVAVASLGTPEDGTLKFANDLSDIGTGAVAAGGGSGIGLVARCNGTWLVAVGF